MHVSAVAIAMLAGAGGVFGMVVGRDSTTVDLHGREVQSTVISSCRWQSPLNVNVYNVLDPDANICNPAGGDVNTKKLNAGDNFGFTTYGTKCKFYVDADWEKVDVGAAFGHADCPGMKDIKGIKRDGAFHDTGDGWDVKSAGCWHSYLPPIWHSVYCYSRIFLTWDGCLSCGDKV